MDLDLFMYLYLEKRTNQKIVKNTICILTNKKN